MTHCIFFPFTQCRIRPAAAANENKKKIDNNHCWLLTCAPNRTQAQGKKKAQSKTVNEKWKGTNVWSRAHTSEWLRFDRGASRQTTKNLPRKKLRIRNGCCCCCCCLSFILRKCNFCVVIVAVCCSEFRRTEVTPQLHRQGTIEAAAAKPQQQQIKSLNSAKSV